MRFFLLLLLMALMLGACGPTAPSRLADSTQSDTTTNVGAARHDPAAARLLSAFFGLDGGLPLPANLGICRGAGGADGMPVVFSHEVDPATVQAGDFLVRNASGRTGSVTCVTFAPATDPGELRTALLVGEFGSPAEPPIAVEIAGNLLSSDRSLNFKGAAVAVTPLAPGPTLVWAEVVPEAQWKLGVQRGSFGVGSGCPTGTRQAVRATWAGGVTTAGGTDAGDAERQRYRVTLALPDGATTQATPFALGDLGDGDNNHLLCLDVARVPRAVAFPAGHLADPNGDLNPDTSVNIQ